MTHIEYVRQLVRNKKRAIEELAACATPEEAGAVLGLETPEAIGLVELMFEVAQKMAADAVAVRWMNTDNIPKDRRILVWGKGPYGEGRATAHVVYRVWGLPWGYAGSCFRDPKLQDYHHPDVEYITHWAPMKMRPKR